MPYHDIWVPVAYNKAVKWHLRKPQLFSITSRKSGSNSHLCKAPSILGGASLAILTSGIPSPVRYPRRGWSQLLRSQQEGHQPKDTMPSVGTPTLNLLFLESPFLGMGRKQQKELYFILWSFWGVRVPVCACIFVLIIKICTMFVYYDLLI